MLKAVVWLLALATLVSGALWVYHDSRRWLQRRPGAPRWKVLSAPWRYFGRGLYTPAGERSRRLAVVFWMLTIVLFILTLAAREAAV